MSKPACSPRYGKLKAGERNRLPDAAFGLPGERKYPVYRIWGKWALPDREHATAAKARAKTALDKGQLTQGQYNRIVRKADKVLAHCSRNDKAGKRKPAKKNPPKKKTAKKKTTKKKGNPSYAELHGGRRGPVPKYTTRVPNPTTTRLTDLGELVELTYRTNKNEMGTFDYVHKFRNPKPRLLVTKNGRGLVVSLGGFRVNERGIVG